MDAVHKKMIYDFSEPVGNSDSLLNYIIGQDENNALQITPEGSVEPLDTMLFAGIKDKSDNELYKGDIVRDTYGRIMVIDYWNFSLCFIAITKTNFHHADFFGWTGSCYGDEDKDTARVERIGNVHENPELLSIEVE